MRVMGRKALCLPGRGYIISLIGEAPYYIWYNWDMKLFHKKEEKKTELEKVEERREEVLATGRKFKYPLQWTKHRVVINTVLVAVAVVGLLLVGGWLALYRLGMTDELLYRVTQILPVSVASVDGENVRFSDYLMLYRSSMASIEYQAGKFTDEESEKVLVYQYKRTALNEAERYTYAIKLARELGISVTQDEINEEFERHRQIGGVDRAEEGFLKIIKDNFGLSKSEYCHLIELHLLKAKVEAAIDAEADSVAKQVEELLAKNGGNYGETAKALGEKVFYEETGGMVSSKNLDGGRSNEAMSLEEGGQSGRFISANGDGYYFVKLIKKTDSEVNFASIRVPFLEFEKRFGELGEGAIREHISIE